MELPSVEYAQCIPKALEFRAVRGCNTGLRRWVHKVPQSGAIGLQWLFGASVARDTLHTSNYFPARYADVGAPGSGGVHVSRGGLRGAASARQAHAGCRGLTGNEKHFLQNASVGEVSPVVMSLNSKVTELIFFSSQNSRYEDCRTREEKTPRTRTIHHRKWTPSTQTQRHRQSKTQSTTN